MIGRRIQSTPTSDGIGITVDEIRENLGHSVKDFISVKVVPEQFINNHPESEIVVGWDLKTYKITQIKYNHED